MIHSNSRSLCKSFSNIKDYLQQFLQPFNIIAITETWLTEDKDMTYELEGYEVNYLNRQSRGGGVALYVDKNLSYKLIEDMTMAVENVLECITIKICTEKGKHVIISCLYRAPGSNIEDFHNWLEKTYSQTSNKRVFICGDINIDLLNPHQHKVTEEFINTMYSLNLYPKITKPSRITAHSATLIDNIFTNDIDTNTSSGLLIHDISDYLPIFLITDFRLNTKYFKKTQYSKQSDLKKPSLA